MRLALQAPAGWETRRRSDGWVAQAPSGVAATLEWTALILRPTAVTAWLETVLSTEVPPQARLERLQRSFEQTRTGWPLHLVDAWIVEDTAVHEMRLAALYEFRNLAASALLRVRDHGVYFGVRQEVLPSLFAASPDFSGALACIAQFWAEPDAVLAPPEDVEDPS